MYRNTERVIQRKPTGVFYLERPNELHVKSSQNETTAITCRSHVTFSVSFQVEVVEWRVGLPQSAPWAAKLILVYSGVVLVSECHGKNCEQICAGSHYKKVLCKASSCKQRCSGSHCYGLECYGKSRVQKCEGSHCTNTICKAGSCKQECYGSHCHGLECYGKSCEHICSGSHCSKVICKSNTCKQSWTGDGCGLKCQGKNCCRHQAVP